MLATCDKPFFKHDSDTYLRRRHGSVRLVWCYLSDLLADQGVILKKTRTQQKLSFGHEKKGKISELLSISKLSRRSRHCSTYQPGLELLPQHLALWHRGLGLETHGVLLLQSNHARHVALYARHHAGVAGPSVHHFVHLWIAGGSVRRF